MTTENTTESQLGATMQAIVQDRYGSTDVLELRTVTRPEPADDEVLIEVHAAGVDRGVEHLMTGEPYLVRLGFGLRRPKQPVPGFDLAGRVVAVGAATTRFRIGDEIMGIGTGAYADYAVAKEAKLVQKPERLSFADAAVVPISAGTALQALTDHGHLHQGERVLVLGASGGASWRNVTSRGTSRSPETCRSIEVTAARAHSLATAAPRRWCGRPLSANTWPHGRSTSIPPASPSGCVGHEHEFPAWTSPGSSSGSEQQ